MKPLLFFLSMFYVIGGCYSQFSYMKLPKDARTKLTLELLEGAPIIIEGKLISSIPLTLEGSESQSHILCLFEKVHVYKNSMEEVKSIKDTFYVVGDYSIRSGVNFGYGYVIGEHYIMSCKPNAMSFKENLGKEYFIMNLYDDMMTSVLQNYSVQSTLDIWYGWHHHKFTTKRELNDFLKKITGIKKK